MAPLSPRAWRFAEVGLAVAVVVLDLATKALVRRRLPLHEVHEIIPGLLSLVHGRNPGMAFGMFSGGGIPAQKVVLALLSAAVLLLVVLHWRRLGAGERLLRIAFPLIAGGAVGNLIERVRLGYVTDFVHVYWGRHQWPDFNVADSAITVGIVLLLIDAVRGVRR
ncbi:MAG TPA: signal peptidase II [Vicinamibacteria bacterium]|nr:signal peptidase II [Vicinamibacteria bacterium]